MDDADLFKPLYKAHRRIRQEDLEGVLDPRSSESVVDIGNYRVEKEPGNKWTCAALPGLVVLHDYLSIDQQKQLVKESLFDFHQNPEHLTNLDAHYDIERPIQLFETDTASSPAVLPNGKLVRDKIRWITLGGQYNWTTKVYPSFEPGTPGCPHFPESLTKSICSEFGVVSEAAIVNYYSEGDILSPHQDVAELAKQDLVSISIGCACIFYIGLERFGSPPLPILLRSGDVVIMGGDSRFAFHGVGRVFSGSSPRELCEHEENQKNFAEWMENHRININVRQMRS